MLLLLLLRLLLVSLTQLSLACRYPTATAGDVVGATPPTNNAGCHVLRQSLGHIVQSHPSHLQVQGCAVGHNHVGARHPMCISLDSEVISVNTKLYKPSQ